MTSVNSMPISVASPADHPAGRRSLVASAKQWINRVAPVVGYQVRTQRRRRSFRSAHGGAEYRAKAALVGAYGKRVLGGPFINMRYGDHVACSAYLAKLVGSYEEELHEIIELIISRNYRTVIDVGCAEGYYAVGLAKRMPMSRVHAFDADPDAQRMCHALARLNGVRNLAIAGWCDHATLQRMGGKNTIVLCDCEGFELDLLDPAQSPLLLQTDMLIELHDVFRPGLTAELLGRFSESHHLTLIDARPRDSAAYATLHPVMPADRPWAVREGREGPMQWAFLVSKSNDAGRA